MKRRFSFRSLQESPVVSFALKMLHRFGQHRVGTHAAALAYYTLLSTVPLLFLVLALGSLFLDAEEVRQLALDGLTALLPSAAEAVRFNVDSILRYRSALGTLSLVGALWSSSGMFTVLEQAVNAVWERPARRAYWKRWLIGVLSLLGVMAWVLFAFFSRTLSRLLPYWIPLLQQIDWPFSSFDERFLSFATILALNVIVYRFFPANTVRWRIALLIGGAVAALWMLTREFFTWALAAGLLRYPWIYGSLWVIIVPLVWAYWSYYLLLLGAEVLAYLEERHLYRVPGPAAGHKKED